MAELTAEIVSVGTELLLGQILDTHAVTMAKLLAECGISCQRRHTVGDNLGRVVSTIRDALARVDIVVTIGGLGPTEDDLTRQAIAEALGDRLVLEPAVLERLKKYFAMRNVPWVVSNGNQAMRPESATLIDNPNGTAPGLFCEKDGKVVFALPGPRSEFNPMAQGFVRDYLAKRSGSKVIHSRILRVCGIGESAIEDSIKELTHAHNPTIAPYAKTGEVHLRLTARAASVVEADRLIDPLEAAVRAILGDAVYGIDETTLEAATLGELLKRKLTIAVAESMTGGMLGQRFTSVAGSSAAFLGGVICYSEPVKQALVGVRAETLSAYGPVSMESAREMAVGIRERIGSDFGVSVTGNAGPEVDRGAKPVGLTFIGIAGSDGCRVLENRFRGGREEIRNRASQAALVALREAVLAKPMPR